MPISKNAIVAMLLRFEKIEDTDLHSSNLSILKACIFVIFFCFRIFMKWAGMRFSSINIESRYFIRKRLRLRKQNKMCSIGQVFFLILLLKNEEKYLVSSDNGDFFTVEFLKYSRLNWESNLCYFSICLHFWKRSYFKNTQSYLWILLFSAGDLELNPGPINYQLNHPSLCGYYRAAIFSVFKRIKLIPRKDKDGKDVFEQPDFDEGLNDLKTIFGDHYAVQQLELEKMIKKQKNIYG